MAGRNASTLEKARLALAERLRARRSEIEQTMLVRVHAVSDPALVGDPTYVTGLRGAVPVALDYGLAAVERGHTRLPPVPAALLAQARLAALRGVSLDTVVRRYVAGYVVLGDFVMQEAREGEQLGIDAIQKLGRDQAAMLETLLAEVTAEHEREARERLSPSGERRTAQVRGLLAGEPLDASELGYELDDWHLGLVATGLGEDEVQELVAGWDRRLLSVEDGGGTQWVWLGGRRSFDSGDLERLVSEWGAGATIAVGEPGHGPGGWRLTHQQALAALPVAIRERRPARYREVALLASMLQDDLLAASLRQLYLEPLEDGGDGGATLRETLRAYFAAERNVSSAAALLGVTAAR